MVRPEPGGRGLPRALEAPLAALGLIATAPIVALAALAVVATSPGPAFFRQERIGRGGRRFELIKLRSMRLADGATVTAKGDSRITAVGRLLRRSKLDELPELWNVLRGDLALVGPRPEVPGFVDAESDAWRQVLAVRPGLTHPVTLRLRDEETLLAASPDPARLYRERLLPWKLAGYLAYEATRTPGRDLGVLAATLLQLLGLRPSPPVTLDDLVVPPPRPDSL